jgi:outer membrane receptor protein involved in Fe transport
VAYELGIRNQFSGNDVLTVTAYYKDIFDYITEKTVSRISTSGGAQYYTTYLNTDYSRVRGIELEYKKRIGNWFRGILQGSYSVATGKSSAPGDNSVRLQQGEPETIREYYLIWDRPVQISLSVNLTVPGGEPLFGFGHGILDDINLYTRIFFQSGKRYTPQRLTGYDPFTGRPQYVSDLDHLLEDVGENWFTVDLNLEKEFDAGIGRVMISLEVQNLFDKTNSQVINPVTGRAYAYGDPTPSSVNDPLYPDVSGDISPFPYNPARYLNPRTVRLGLGFRF